MDGPRHIAPGAPAANHAIASLARLTRRTLSRPITTLSIERPSREFQQETRGADAHPPRSRAERVRRAAYFPALTIAKAAPWGSRACTIQAPPGTSIGPFRIWPPRVKARSAAAATLSTAM